MNEHRRQARYRDFPAGGRGFERTIACGTMDDSGEDMVKAVVAMWWR